MENLFTVCFDSDDDSFVLEEFNNLEDAIKFCDNYNIEQIQYFDWGEYAYVEKNGEVIYDEIKINQHKSLR